MCNKILKEPEARILLIVVSCHIMLYMQLEKKLIKHTEDLRGPYRMGPSGVNAAHQKQGPIWYRSLRSP